MRARSYFISATGTDAGKTHATVALIHALRARSQPVVAQKPVASGVVLDDAQSDAARLAAALGLPLSAAQANQQLSAYHFAAPTAPQMAARLEGVVMEWERIVAFCQPPVGDDAWWLVEGAGGLYSPITEHATNADLALALGLPVLLVVDCRLGGIGHALATLKAAQADQLRIAGLILNASDAEGALAPKAVQAALAGLVGQVLPPTVCMPRAGMGPEPDFVTALALA